MKAYVADAVRLMLMYGRSRASFVPLLWLGLRDWETSSAWARGKVSWPSFHCLPAQPTLFSQQVLLIAIKFREVSPSVPWGSRRRAERFIFPQAVKQAAEHHQQIKVNELSISMGIDPNAALHRLAHVTSLTTRQARRSGVSEGELRARWG
jgi:hypothetical protein